MERGLRRSSDLKEAANMVGDSLKDVGENLEEGLVENI